jgi:hypothetical protein
MFSFFRQTFRHWARSGTRTGAPKTPVRLQCEVLEDRVLPSVSGSEILVNTQKVGVQSQAVSATSSNGMSVVVWTDFNKSHAGVPANIPDGNIDAQIYNAAGQKVGGVIQVASGRTPLNDPTVAMDANGNFVVAWVYAYDATDTDIHAARFHANGTRNGSEFIVADSPKNESDPSAAMDAKGDFVISYAYQYGTNDSDIHANLYHSTGTFARTMEVAITTQNEYHARVAMTASGAFDISYTRADNVFLQRYNSSGTLLGTSTIASTSALEENSALSVDSKGNAIVVWQVEVGRDWNILARSVSSTGSLGGVFTVSATSALETNPVVAIDPLTGHFGIAYQTKSGNTTNIVVKDYSSSHALLNTATALTNTDDPAISVGGSAHRFIVVGDSLVSKGGDYDGGVFARFGIL